MCDRKTDWQVCENGHYTDGKLDGHEKYQCSPDNAEIVARTQCHNSRCDDRQKRCDSRQTMQLVNCNPLRATDYVAIIGNRMLVSQV
jgi:hypothetical protein